MNDIYDDGQFFQAYAQMPRSREGLKAAGEWYRLQPLFPDVRGKQVLDLGCGWHCKYAAQMGAARIVGIDGSRKMIETARQRNPDEKIQYLVQDLEAYEYPEDTYDLVISNLVLHYIEHLDPIYRKVYGSLKDGGVFLFNIEHPVFTAGINQDWVYDDSGRPSYWPVDRYYEPGKRETLFLGEQVVKYHHTLTQILNPLIQIGFQIQAVEEAEPSQEMMDVPGMKDEMRRPMMLLVRAAKQGEQTV